jgi:ferredoxin
LLQSALQAGIQLDSSCRNGTCRSCICRLASGSVLYRIAWPGLSAEEKTEGFILPCVAYPASDVTLALPEPLF